MPNPYRMLNPYRWARYYAEKAHIGQLYDKDGPDPKPYTFHLEATFQVALRFLGTSAPHLEQGELDFPEDAFSILEACLLHDTIEDTGATRDELGRLFGAEVATLVWLVTSELGKNRRERNAATYPKTRQLPGAVFVKLCDRIANVEYGLAQMAEGVRIAGVPVQGARSLVQMYAREHAGFRAALYRHQEHAALWQHLDALLEPHCLVGELWV